MKKRNKNFDDFYNLIYYDTGGEEKNEKIFDRQRLRGLLELDMKYVDFKYIAEIKAYKR